MNYKLLREKWLPVIRADGSHDRIAPFEIVGGDSPPVDLIPPRPDFRASLFEFLIGLIQTVYPPEQEQDWEDKIENPPSQEELESAMVTHESYFNLFGNRPRFMQDLTMSETDKPARNSVSAMLIDSPGGNTLKQNTDFFNKRNLIKSLCPACAAMAIFTLQTFAPPGGQGHRTSLRGGGPLSTLVKGGELDERVGDTLWEKVWLNVMPLSFPKGYKLPESDKIAGNVFPWAAPTRTSENGEEVSPDDVHPLHAYWAMPRRIVLEEGSESCTCSICGMQSGVSVKSYLTRPSGYNYSDTWIHPLSPYRVQTGKPPLSVKGQANISAYSHWLGIVYGQPVDEAGKKSRVVPALCIQHAVTELLEAEISAAGYDMDNMKARQWCEHDFPFCRAENETSFRETTDLMIQAANKVRSNLVGAVKDALVNDAGKNQAKIDKSFFANIGAAFWAGTSARFYEIATEIAKADDEDLVWGLLDKWARHIHSKAGNLFQEYVMSAHIPPERYGRYVTSGQKMRAFNYSWLTKNGLLKKGESK